MTNGKQINCLIVEDEPAANRFLKKTLEKFFPQTTVVGTAFNVAEAVACIKQNSIDLIFLDIELPNGNGFTLFDHFENPAFKVIFTTAYDEYAIQAFKVAAVDYLLKPLDLDDLETALSRYDEMSMWKEDQTEVLKQGIKNNYGKIGLPCKEGIEFVEMQSIVRCEADSNYTCFHFKDGSRKLVSKTLKEFSDILEKEGFYRANRSDLINLKCVAKYTRAKKPVISLQDGSTVMLSPQKRDDFLSCF